MSSTVIDGSEEMTAVPWLADTRALFYRIDACRKAGVDPEKDFATWDSFKNALKKLNNIEINGKKLAALGMPGKNDWNVHHNYAPWIYGAGEDFLNSDFTKSTLSSNETFSGIKFYSELAVEGLMDRQSLAMNTADIEAKFIKGDYATTISGSWFATVLEIKKDNGVNFIENVGVTMLPEGPKGRYAYLGGSSLVVFKSSQNQNKAIKLIEYLTTEEAQIEYCKKTELLPVVKSAYDHPWIKGNRMRKVFAEQMNYAKGYPAMPAWHTAETYIVKALSKVWDNVTEGEVKYSPERTIKILEKADRDIDKTLRYYLFQRD
ncbi:extracellular solute-binding protein [Acetivibrio straminisolvens]|uniref:Extracellular solute-binding protein n=2 Tax=Acetivibrio straminisolvens TaxID=253314 RepID=W4V170_9FIRM|nr:extracellular solute-binding protein [Acetivibrio straminisolvens]GAE86956.1 hypothetical protein JCM21531_292 [Acetivibrio straminisolvens JCM 21531]